MEPTTNFKNSLVIGAFFPLHKAHLDLFKCAFGNSQHVNIAVKTQVSKTLRKNKEYHPEEYIKSEITALEIPPERYSFLGLNDVSKLTTIDVIIGNNEESKFLATALRIPLHATKMHENVSSNEIRKSPLKNWDYLPNSVRAYFCKQVLVIGAESTGKSFLAKSLAKTLDGEYVEEYGRTYDEIVKSHLYNEKNHHDLWAIDDFDKIALGQDDLIEKAKLSGKKLILVDTDAVISEIFAWLYIRETSKILKECIKKQTFDLIVYLDYENTKYENDSIRVLSDKRKFNSEFIKESFNFYKKDFEEFSNKDGYETREKNVRARILQILDE